MTIETIEIPEASLATAEQPVAERLRLSRWHVWLLIAITLLGGILRFWKIDQPAIWGDEAATYSRICGNYQQLLDILQNTGFAPLHYELYHWIRVGMPLWGHTAQAPIKEVRYRHFFDDSDPDTSPTASGEKVPTKTVLYGDHPLVPGGVRMTPFVMRIVPALAGIAMVPAMYFLVVQIARKEIALIAALFTATSAYMLVYSRDAKMYMDLWLFCTLSAACLLWWLRSRTRLSWLCWVAASCAMCGLHAPGAILLGVELLIFLSRDRRWWITGIILLAGFVVSGYLTGETNFFGNIIDTRWIVLGFAFLIGIIAHLCQRRRNALMGLYFLLGTAIILSGIGGYYLNFNRFKERIDQGNWEADSNLDWIGDYNKNHDGIDLMRYAGTAFLCSWEWATPDLEKDIDPRALRLLHGSIEMIAVLLLIGLIPWRRKCRQPDELNKPPPGRRFFWTAAWVIVPAYAFYCVSAQRNDLGILSSFASQLNAEHSKFATLMPRWQPAFASPNSWFGDVRDWLAASPRFVWLIIPLAIVLGIALSGCNTMQRIKRVTGLLGCLAILYALLLGVYLLLWQLNYRAYEDGNEWHSIWIPRYLGFIWPAMAAGVATLLWRLPTMPLRYGAITLLVAMNLCQFSERVHASEPPTDLFCRDIINSQPASTSRTYLAPNFSKGFGASPGEGLLYSFAARYYLATDSNMTVEPYDFGGGRQRFYNDFHIVSVIAPLYIQIDTRRDPKIDRIITWEKITPNFRDANRDDPLPAQLGTTWKRTSEQVFNVYDHWRWIKLYQVRRREYVRISR